MLQARGGFFRSERVGSREGQAGHDRGIPKGGSDEKQDDRCKPSYPE
jgi:hypothetical protein